MRRRGFQRILVVYQHNGLLVAMLPPVASAAAPRTDPSVEGEGQDGSGPARRTGASQHNIQAQDHTRGGHQVQPVRP